MEPKYFEFVCPVKIISGRMALSNLPHELSQLNAFHPMIITDKGVAGAGLLAIVEGVFKDSDIDVQAVFEDTPPDSSNRVINKVAKLYRREGCDALVAVGGGSVIDTAKGVNIVLAEETDDLLKFQGVDRIHGTMRPFIVIPTTAGTGSEVTSAAVIYNEETGAKMAFMSNKIYPDVALVDPKMMTTMPAKITAATGMDALTHACEAMTCIQKNPVSDAFAASAIKLISTWLIEAVTNGENEDARLGMADAALLAGIAFSNSMVGMVHSMAHATGGVAHVPHGVANSILLPYGLTYNKGKVAKHIAEIAQLMNPNSRETNEDSLVTLAIKSIESLKEELHTACGLPRTLSEAGVKEDQLEAIAKLAVDDGSLTYNPREATYDDLLSVLKKAL